MGAQVLPPGQGEHPPESSIVEIIPKGGRCFPECLINVFQEWLEGTSIVMNWMVWKQEGMRGWIMEGTISRDEDSVVRRGGQKCGAGIKVLRIPGPQQRHCWPAHPDAPVVLDPPAQRGFALHSPGLNRTPQVYTARPGIVPGERETGYELTVAHECKT